MTVTLQQLVTTRLSPTSFGDRKAVIELHDDNRFVMFLIDHKTQARTETLVDAPAASITVGGTQSYLLINDGQRKRRVDFKNPNTLTGLAIGGAIGMAVADTVGNTSGIKTWVEALRAHGARIKYSAISTSFKVIMITFGALMLSLVIAVAVLSLFR